MILSASYLVKGNQILSGRKEGVGVTAPLLRSDVALSFWGGIDPITGVVIDTNHPLQGQCVAGTILCLPSGRGSCTASQVLLELILNDKAPKAFVFRDNDGLACVGAIIAQEVFAQRLQEGCVPDIVQLDHPSHFEELLQTDEAHYAALLPNASLLTGSTPKEILDCWPSSIVTETPTTTALDKTTQIDLSPTEQSWLDRSASEAERIALRVLFRYARLTQQSSTSPPSYFDITQAHIDGCTYIGPGGLEFTQRLVQANGKVKVPTTLNSVSADRRQHSALGVPLDYADASIALGDAYLDLGCTPSFTCAPYLLSNPPSLGENIAWGESNAVVYANSVLGAQTEKYADYLDICCALVGKVPATGVHLPVHRQPQVILDAKAILQDVLASIQRSDKEVSLIHLEMLFPTLGHLCGTLSDGKVPLVIGFEDNPIWSSTIVTKDHLKAFCAAFGTTASAPLVHIAGITPEAIRNSYFTETTIAQLSTKTITWDLLNETFSLLDSQGGEKVDLIALGNPHLSVSECQKLAMLIQEGRMVQHSEDVPQKDPNVRIMACISRTVQAEAEKDGSIQVLQNFGLEFINDTCWCMLLDPPIIPQNVNATILTNSGKYAHYGPGLTNRSFRYGSLEDCLAAAVTGIYGKPQDTTQQLANLPAWLQQRSSTMWSMKSADMQRRTYTTSRNADTRGFLGSAMAHKPTLRRGYFNSTLPFQLMKLLRR